MTLRVIHTGLGLPTSYPVDPNASFQAGQIGQIVLYGNNIVVGVSDSTAPLFILDDTKSTSFYSPSIDETHTTPVVGQMGGGGRLVTITPTTVLLNHANISANSFVCDIQVYLTTTNGAVTIPVGTELNYDEDGDGTPDSVKFVCSYSYQAPGMPGDDTTAGSRRVTCWYSRILFETDQYEVSQRYPLNTPLFCSENGKLTSSQLTATTPAVAICLAGPTARNNFLAAMWL